MDKMIWTNEWEKCHFDYERTAEGARSADKDGADDDGQDTGADNPLREWMPSDASDLGHPRSFENVGMADRLRMLLWLIHWQLDENKEFKEWIRAECKSKDTRDAFRMPRVILRSAWAGYMPFVDHVGDVRVFNCGRKGYDGLWSLKCSTIAQVEELVAGLNKHDSGCPFVVQESSSQQSFSLDTLMCSVCKEAGDESKLVICENAGVEGIRNCQLAIHTYCLKPKLRKVPDGDFYCPRCKSLSSSQQLCATLRSRILSLSTSRSAIEQERRAAIERKRIAADRKEAARQQYLLMQSTRSSRRRKQVDYTGAAFDKMISESIRNAEGKEKKSRSSRSRRQESDDGDWQDYGEEEEIAEVVKPQLSRAERAAARRAAKGLW